MNSKSIVELDYGNCGIVRFRGKEAYIKDVSLRTGTWYKADGMVKLAPHSEDRSSVLEVNHEAVHWNNVSLPGEASICGQSGFQSTRKAQASAPAMVQTSQFEESAEGIVVTSEPVSSCVSLMRNEECGKPLWSKARTQRRANNRRCSVSNHATHFEENRFPQQTLLFLQYENSGCASNTEISLKSDLWSLFLRNRRATDPYGRWCGRRES